MLKIPVNLKILAFTTVVLAGAVGYIIQQSITIQQQDKMSHAYQSQLNETILLGDKFNSLIDNSSNSLRQIAALDWKNPNPASVNSILQNQKEIDRVYLIEVPLVSDQELKTLFKSSNELGDAEEKLVTHSVINRLESLTKTPLSIVNLSADRGTPLVGIIIADLKFDEENNKALAAVAVLKTNNLFAAPEYDIEITDKQGNLIFATDIKTLISTKPMQIELSQAAWSGQLKTATLEYVLNKDKHLGSYYKLPHDLVFTTSQPLVKILSSVYVTTQKMILIGLLALGLSIIGSFFIARRISGPILSLTDATKQLASGNFKIKIKKKSNDEVGELAQSFELMSTKIEKLLVTEKEKSRLDNEMNIVATVQKTLFPNTNITTDHVDIVSHYAAASECGGDLWGYFTNGSKLYFIIADATGHGLPSALITVSAKSTLSLVKRMLEQNHQITPKEILSYANRSVFETSQGKIMMTCFVGEIDFETGLLTYANAGHNPPWVFSGDKVHSLSIPGTRLGEVSEQVEFKEKTLTLLPGDKIFLYTDGIVENTNSKGEMFDKKRVRNLVKENLKQGIDKTLKVLLTEFKKFIGSKPHLDDDTTVVIMDIKKIQSQKEAA